MKTFIADIIPKIQRFSQDLENMTLLTNRHWVLIDEIANSKNVYIFRTNNELLIAKNGKVEKAKWEYLGNNSLLIDIGAGTYLFRHGFIDENILALKVDSKDEFALFLNESKFSEEINNIKKLTHFVSSTYLNSKQRQVLGAVEDSKLNRTGETDQVYNIKQGQLRITKVYDDDGKRELQKVYLNDQVAPDGKYSLGMMWYLVVKRGTGHFTTSFFNS